MTVDGKEFTQPLLVEPDPQFGTTMIAEDEEEVWW
jgi:hypothetical protein